MSGIVRDWCRMSPVLFRTTGCRLLLSCQAHVARRKRSHTQHPTRQDHYPSNPQNVPEASDYTSESGQLPEHLRNVDNARLASTTAKRFLVIDDDERGQQRDSRREGDDANLGGEV